MIRSPLLPPLLFSLAFCLGAHIPDSDREVVTVTEDEDGAPRERRIWFAWLEDELYIRTTPRATWGANVLRTGFVVLVSRGERHAFVATRVEDAAQLERIHERFRRKYGSDDWWADRVRFFFGGKIVFRLTPS